MTGQTGNASACWTPRRAACSFALRTSHPPLPPLPTPPGCPPLRATELGAARTTAGTARTITKIPCQSMSRRASPRGQMLRARLRDCRALMRHAYTSLVATVDGTPRLPTTAPKQHRAQLLTLPAGDEPAARRNAFSLGATARPPRPSRSARPTARGGKTQTSERTRAHRDLAASTGSRPRLVRSSRLGALCVPP